MTCRQILLLVWTVGLALALTLGLAACAGVPEIRVPREIAVPTPVPCLSPADVPQRPALRTDDEILALEDYRALHALWAAWGRLQAYVQQLEIVARRCAEIPHQHPP